MSLRNVAGDDHGCRGLLSNMASKLGQVTGSLGFLSSGKQRKTRGYTATEQHIVSPCPTCEDLEDVGNA